MAPLPGTDSDKQLQPKQERWLAALPNAKSDTEAARIAEYAHPRDAAYANRRSELVRRECESRFEEAAAWLARESNGDATPEPRLLPFVTLLRRTAGSYRSVGLTILEQETDAKGRTRTHKRYEVVQDHDNMAEVKAAEVMLRLVQLDGPAVRNNINVDARKQTVNVAAPTPTMTPPNAPDLSQAELQAEIRRRMAMIRSGRGAELMALPEPEAGGDAPLDAGFREDD